MQFWSHPVSGVQLQWAMAVSLSTYGRSDESR
jgi:hypothetical protein